MTAVLTLAQAAARLGLSETQVVRRSSSAGLGYVRDLRFVRPSDMPALAGPPPPWPPHISDPEAALDSFEQRLMVGMRAAGITGLG